MQGKPIPALLGRDPRNEDHLAAAFDILQSMAGMNVLQATADELRELGLPLSKRKPKIRVIKTGDVAVGMPYLLERGLILPGNMISKCVDCGNPVQFRPHTGLAINTHLCPFCAAEQVIKEQKRST